MDEVAMDEVAMDEVAMDKVAMDEVAMDEVGMDEVGMDGCVEKRRDSNARIAFTIVHIRFTHSKRSENKNMGKVFEKIPTLFTLRATDNHRLQRHTEYV